MAVLRGELPSERIDAAASARLRATPVALFLVDRAGAVSPRRCRPRPALNSRRASGDLGAASGTGGASAGGLPGNACSL